MSTPAAEGLRERKKRETREAIAAAAMRLFRERGFGAVTVIEIAREAGVSEKTVFNYFPTKEDLVFPRTEQLQEALIETIRSRPAGTSIVEGFRRWTDDWLDRLERGPADDVIAVPRLVLGNEALRNRLFLGWEQQVGWLAPLVAEEAGADDPDDVLPEIAARTLVWTHRAMFRRAMTRLMAGENPRRVAADLRVRAREAYDLLEGGLGGYGVRGDGRRSAAPG